MSEKIYAWLLRLYPSHFRSMYGDEAMQLFRDRRRDEKGLLAGMRLWLDLWGDLAVSVPRSYGKVPAPVVSLPQHCADGMPSFHSLEDETLGVGSLVNGAIGSLLVFSLIVILFGKTGSAIAGHGDGWRRGSYSSAVARPMPKVSLAYVPAGSGVGSMASLTVTVSSMGSGPTPTGYVRFFDGNVHLSTGKLNNGTVTVQCTLSNFVPHALRAVYYDDDHYGSMSSTGRRQ